MAHVVAHVGPKERIDFPCEFQKMRGLMDTLKVTLKENPYLQPRIKAMTNTEEINTSD